jgi:stage V sporulation protein B
MEKAVKMGKVSATGSFQLFIGRILSTLLLAIGTIVVGLYIQEGDYGLYTIALVPAATLLLFQDWGVGPALTKYCANYRVSGKEGELRGLIVSGLVFASLTGLTLTFLLVGLSNFMASAIYNKPESAYLISLSSITIISTAVYTFSISIITGFERMSLSSVTMIISGIVQGFLSPLLVYLGFGATGAVVGFTSATASSAIVGLVLLYYVIYKNLPEGKVNKRLLFQNLKQLLHYGIPLSVSIIIAGIGTQIYYFVMARSVEVAMIGNFSIANNFTVFLTFFIFPLQAVLFPAFSKLDPLKEKELLKTIYSSSVKYSSLFMVPATMAVMVLASPLVHTLYGDKWLSAPLFLTLIVAGNLVVLLGNVSFSRLLYAMGETKMLIKLSLIDIVIGVPLAFLLIPPFGIAGLIIGSTMIAPVSGLVIGVYWTWKKYGTKPDFSNSLRILLASTIASLFTFLFLQFFEIAAWVILIGGSAVFLLTYIFFIPLVGAVNLVDMGNLRLLVSESKFISKILEIPIMLIEKTLSVIRSNKKLD